MEHYYGIFFYKAELEELVPTSRSESSTTCHGGWIKYSVVHFSSPTNGLRAFSARMVTAQKPADMVNAKKMDSVLRVLAICS
jgi:hypothetical protein